MNCHKAMDRQTNTHNDKHSPNNQVKNYIYKVRINKTTATLNNMANAKQNGTKIYKTSYNSNQEQHKIYAITMK